MPLTDLRKILNSRMDFPRLSPLGLLHPPRLLCGLTSIASTYFCRPWRLPCTYLAAFDNLGQCTQSYNERSSQQCYVPTCLPRWLDISSSYCGQASIWYTHPDMGVCQYHQGACRFALTIGGITVA